MKTNNELAVVEQGPDYESVTIEIVINSVEYQSWVHGLCDRPLNRPPLKLNGRAPLSYNLSITVSHKLK